MIPYLDSIALYQVFFVCLTVRKGETRGEDTERKKTPDDRARFASAEFAR